MGLLLVWDRRVDRVHDGGVRRFIWVLLLWSLIIVLEGQSVGNTKQCQSIDQNGKYVSGRCIQFLLCPRLLEFAKRPGKTVDDFRLLKTLTCGFHKDQPWICCPEKEVYRPPGRDENHQKLELQFPDDDGNDALSKISGSPDVPFSIGSSKHSLIPKLEDCGEPRFDFVTSTRIIGGFKSQKGQFPYMALLYRIDTVTDEEEYYCSGTIINQFYILTAAHCILTNRGSDHQLAYVQVGVTDVTERCHKSSQRECLHDRRYDVKETVIHPKYIYGSRDRSHDIALIRTAKPIDMSEKYVRPVCLPLTRSYELKEESLGANLDGHGERSGLKVLGEGVVAGWGRESNTGPQSSSTLKHAVLPILSRRECQDRYGTQVTIRDHQICAGGSNSNDSAVCVGDSGGPLLMPFEPERYNGWEERFTGKMFQTGIVSFGPALCGSSGKPSVFTKLLPYVDWILDSMYL